MLNYIDVFLNKITMYRLMLYYLIAVVVFSCILAFFGFLPYTPIDIIFSSIVAVIVGVLSNLVFAKVFKAVTNVESVFITSLILILISPIKFPSDILFLALAVVIAMASKYILATGKRHIFNPAAIAVVITGFLGYGASWWVGTSLMFPVVLSGGLLLARKIQRERIIFYFFATYSILVFATTFLVSGFDSAAFAIKASILDSPLLFFIFVMFVEPQTSPTTKKLRSFYSFLVSLIYATGQLGILRNLITPEMALSIGNIFTYIANPNYRLSLSLKRKKQLSSDIYEFVFSKQNNFDFTPGQYMEWTLPHKNADSRGNRRYFSISSSPTEEEIAITVKFYDPSSSYKKVLVNLNENEKIIAAQLAGDFVLPEKFSSPLVFIAGGVGITPFRSMSKYITDKNLKCDIILIYSNRTYDEILFQDVFKKAEKNGVKTVYCLTNEKSFPKDWQGIRGHITSETIEKEVPNFKKRTFYISGPQLMVQGFEKTLREMGVSRNQIKTDFFPGYSENK